MEGNVIFDVTGLVMNGQRMYYSYIKNMTEEEKEAILKKIS